MGRGEPFDVLGGELVLCVKSGLFLVGLITVAWLPMVCAGQTCYNTNNA